MVWLISIFKWVLYSTALASLLSLIILFFKLVLKDKLGVRWHYAIWLIVIIRLLMPYGLQSSISVFNIFNFDNGKVIQVPYTINTEASENVNSKTIDADVTPNSLKPTSILNTADDNTIPIYLKLISCSWLLGTIVLGAYAIVMTVRLKVKFKNYHACENQEVNQLLLQGINKLKLRSNIKIINTDQIKTPCVLGFIRPKLLLPIGIEDCVNKNELEFIILHELAHIKRLDIIVGCISGALQIIHWFNPIIWYSFYRMRNDKELACDALALSYIDSNDYLNYGKTIIKLLESYKKTPQVYGISYIINNKSQIKRRITMISLFKKNSYKWSIIPIVTLTLLGGVMLTNAKNNPVLADNKDNQKLSPVKISSEEIKTNAITQYAITGKHFKGTMLMIPSDKKIVAGFSKYLGKDNEATSEIAKDNNAICAINAGGFTSDDGGKTFSPKGLIMQDGKVIYKDLKDDIRTDIVAFTDKGILLVGKYSLNELNKLNATEVVSSGPTLIVNGKPTITQGDGGLGVAPRTAIGQKNDGTIIMLTIDGRSVKSIGATLHDVQNILIEYGAINAANLDGGSSSTMYYKGKVINNPCGGLIESGNVMINDPDNKGEIKVVSTFMVLP